MAQAELEAALAEEPLQEAQEPLEAVAELENESEHPEPADDGFIAPPAAEVQAQAAPQPAIEASHADPFAAAELANSGQRRVPAQEAEADMAAPRKAKGLLAKVTGAARAFHEATQSNGQPEPAQGAPRSEAAGPAGVRKTAAPRQATAARPPAGEARVEQAAAPAPSAATQKPAAAKTDPALNQPRLTGLDPAERVGVSQSEEDLLDIPAFLRRQAN